jgi:hypothetical protein
MFVVAVGLLLVAGTSANEVSADAEVGVQKAHGEMASKVED